MSSATIGFGTLFKRDGTTIAECTNGSHAISRDTIDVTHHASTGGWREFIAGLKNGGQVTLDLNFLPADATQSFAAGLMDDLVDGTLQSFSIVYTDSGTTTATFSAYVINFQTTAPVDGKLGASCTLQVSGAVSMS